jgi:hypothetical protein
MLVNSDIEHVAFAIIKALDSPVRQFGLTWSDAKVAAAAAIEALGKVEAPASKTFVDPDTQEWPGPNEIIEPPDRDLGEDFYERNGLR